MEDSRSQGRFGLGLLKDPREMLQLAGTTGGHNRDGGIVTDVVAQLNIKTAIGAVSIND